jgi:hypothetical protein
MILFLIRDPETNLFSNGGTHPQFTKNGKIWTGIGGLKNHVNYGIAPNEQLGVVSVLSEFLPYMKCEVIIFETETMTSRTDPDWLRSYIKFKAAELVKKSD